MGGDHKCPVCEATFTRPQHVARHMRSHTGDRPYKCQHCGDQFARSDLLSRHVNKCHANEKPLPSTGVRKKGSVSASRATTSKQVCDQCVQANSSCDGCNPCAKCVQRRYRCTFVKFHRQTAPLGPGHTTRTAGAESSFSTPPSPNSIAAPLASRVSAPSSRDPVFHHPPHQSDDEFILGQAPTVVPTMADALYGATPYTFPPLYPTNDINGDNTDFVGKYRAHAELFGSSTRSAIPASSPSMVSPNLYDPRPPSSWLGWGQQDPTDPYQQEQQRHADLISNSTHPPSSISDKDMQVELAGRHHHHQHRSNTNPNHYMNASIPFSVLQSTASNYHLVSDPNGNVVGAESTDIHGSDHSASSSAASSFVHLPLLGVDNISSRSVLVRGGYDNNADRRATSSSSSSSSSHHHPHSDHHHHHQNLAFQSKQVSAFPTTSHDENAFSSNQHHHHQQQQHPHPNHQQQQVIDLGRPEFSSAFGLLSLDDPNVIAGIATDGTPFFDNPNQAHNQAQARHGSATSGSATSGSTTTASNIVQLDGSSGGVADVDTPMPLKRGSGQLQLPVGSTPSREKDSKELKEFWKQYMRFPLSGSDMLSSMSGSEGVTPSGIGSKATNTSGSYRRPRVASLPAVKTPIVERARDHLDSVYMNNNTAHPSASTLNATAYMRRASSPEMLAAEREMENDMDTSGMENLEDLRSYEAAVMARKAPTMLNLKVRRPMKGRGRAGGTGGKLGGDEGSASASASSGNNSPRADTTDCSSSSSLANAFGTGRLNNSHSLSAAPAPSATLLPFAGRVKKEKSCSPSLSSPATSSAEGDDNPSELGSLEYPSPLISGPGGNNNNNMGTGRPSFKRLPSQTLGPDNSKRPFYGFGGEVEDRIGSGWGAIGNNNDDDDDDDRKDTVGGGGGGGSAERRMRRRRMSEPSTGGGGGFGEDKKTSRVDVSAVQNVDELWFTSF